jgi:hypothetical protein
MPVDAVYPWLLTPVLSCCTGGHGCNAHPAFPAPSLFSGAVYFQHLGRNRAARIRRCGSMNGASDSSVVPAQAGTHSHRTRFCEGCSPNSLHTRTPVIMDPGLRRDDEKRDDEKEGFAGRAKAAGGTAVRSPILTIFWHCGFAAFSFRTRPWARPGNEPSMVLAEDCVVFGSGNADVRRKVRSSGGGGPGRSSSRARCCAAAHPPDRRASAS